MQANPEVEVCVSDPTYAWIRIHGTAVFEDNMAVKEGAMNNPTRTALAANATWILWWTATPAWSICS